MERQGRIHKKTSSVVDGVAAGDILVWDGAAWVVGDHGDITGVDDGTAQGQMLFWDNANSKWTYAETTEIFWDDVGKIFTPVALTVTGSTVLGLNSAVFQPTTDSATFFQVKDEDGNVFLTGDSVNNKTISPTFNATDEDNVLQIDGTTVLRTGTLTDYNIFLGEDVFATDDGQYNIGIGYQAGRYAITSNNNVYMGYQAGFGKSDGTSSTGDNNVGIGYYALRAIEDGSENFALGSLALWQNKTGIRNVAIGKSSLSSNTGGGWNVALGSFALGKCTDRYNLGIGYAAASEITTGSGNIAIGANSLGFNQQGASNTIIGYQAGGIGAGAAQADLSNHVCIGRGSGYNLANTSDSDIFIGYKSGYRQTTGSDLLIIDNQDRTSAALELTNSLIYGVFNATPASQSLRINAGTFILGNPVHSDADSGGAVLLQGIREDGAGTASTAGQIEISHDGIVANNQLGKIILSVNTGAGLVQALEIGSDLLATYAGGVNAVDGTFTGDMDITGDLDVTGDAAFGPVSVTPLTGLSLSKHVTITSAGDVSNRKGIHASVQVGKTGLADYTGVVTGLSTQVQLDDANTQDWTNANAIRGFNADVNTESSTLGTIVGMSGYNVSANIQDAARVTNFYGYKVGTIQSFGGKLLNAYGVHISDITAGDTLNYAIYTGAGTVRLGGEILGFAGAKIGDGGTTNYTHIDSGGRLLLEGTAQTWEDLRIIPGAFQFPGTADPTLESWQPGGTGATYKVYKFKKDDEVHFSCQLPHTYKEGSDLKPHIHWTPCDRGNEENGNYVGWKIDYSWANIDAAYVASATVDLSDACSGTDDMHELTASGTITGTGKTISSILTIRLYRSDTNGDDTWVGATAALSPAILEFDLHFEIDSLGSDLELVKDAP